MMEWILWLSAGLILLLVEILALSYAVRAPSNWAMPATEFTA